MLGSIFQRRAYLIACLDRTFQVLDSKIRILSDTEILANHLDYVIHNARQDPEPCNEVTFEVKSGDVGNDIWKDGISTAQGLSAGEALTDLFRQIHRYALGLCPDYARLHAGTARLGRKRFIIIGDQQAGKSTLMTKLAFSGFAVEGDELILLKDVKAKTFPRKFYVREGSLALLPEFAKIAGDLPSVNSVENGKIYAFDPHLAGFEWRLTNGALDAVFFLHSNHGKETRIEGCPKYEMMSQVMSQCNPPEDKSGNWLGDICCMIDQCDTYNLYNGDLDTALEKIRAVLS